VGFEVGKLVGPGWIDDVGELDGQADGFRDPTNRPVTGPPLQSQLGMLLEFFTDAGQLGQRVARPVWIRTVARRRGSFPERNNNLLAAKFQFQFRFLLLATTALFPGILFPILLSDGPADTTVAMSMAHQIQQS